MASRSGKFALVIGNGAYTKPLNLDSPPLDAAAMTANLRELGFDVTTGVDLGFNAMEELLDVFVAKLGAASSETALFYFSGHGLQIHARNYAVPIDFDKATPEGVIRCLSVQSVIERLSKVSFTRIILLDACRDGDDDEQAAEYKKEFESQIANKSIMSGLDGKSVVIAGEIESKLATMTADENTFIAFATAEGREAYGGFGNSLSLFTAAFVKHMKSVDLPLTNLTSRVRVEVGKLTRNKQNTWDQSSLNVPFFFNPGSLLLFTGNAMALVGLIVAFVPYSLLLTTDMPWQWILIAAALPVVSLGILLFGMQTAYSRLRGSFDVDIEKQVSLFDHMIWSLQKGSTGGYLGALFAGLGIAIPYHDAWARIDLSQPGKYDPLEPLGAILLEITISTALTACLLGFLSLFCTRTAWSDWRFQLTSNRSDFRTMVGAMAGGMLAGLIAAPILTVYFGLMSRPDMSPNLLVPGAILGAVLFVFSIVNFDFERLTLRRISSSALAAVAALGVGVVAAIVVFGLFWLAGTIQWDTNWMHNHSEDFRVLAVGGAIYGVPTGAVLGCVIGAAILLTARWSHDPLF